MKKLLIYVVLCLTISFARASTVQFINNQSAPAAASLDIYYQESGEDEVLLASAIDRYEASAFISVPDDVLITIIFKTAGTQNVFSSNENEIFENFNEIYFIYGTSTQRYTHRGSFPRSTSAGNFICHFHHSTAGYQKIDAIAYPKSNESQTSVLADDFGFGDRTFFNRPVTQTGDLFIDIVHFFTQDPLQRFSFDATGLSGEAIYFFTAGSSTDMRVFYAKSDGTVIELEEEDIDISGLFEPQKRKTVSTYPNPCTESISFDSDIKGSFVIRNTVGQPVKSGILGESPIPVAELSNGNYTITLRQEDKVIVGRFVKQ